MTSHRDGACREIIISSKCESMDRDPLDRAKVVFDSNEGQIVTGAYAVCSVNREPLP